MSKFDDVMVNAKNLLDNLGDKIADCANLTNLNIIKSQIDGEIKGQLKALGINVYQHSKNADVEDKSAEIIDKLNQLETQKERIVEQIQKVKSNKKCPVCSQYVNIKSNFCPKCGSKF